MTARILIFLALSGWTTAARSAPITFNTALPVAMDEFIVREQLIINQSGDDPSGMARDRSTWAAVSVLGYGVSGDLALFGVIPYISTTLKLNMGGTRLTRRAEGLGDMKIFGRYTIYKNNFRGGSFRIAPFAGIKAPTAVQPGSGSWDPFGGVVITYQILDFQIDAGASYQANGTTNGIKFGDVSRLDASFQYRLWPRELGRGIPGFLYGVMEVNLIHHNSNRINGLTDPNSGGTRLFLVPGLQYVTRRWIIESSIQLPVIQDLNGMALENKYIIRAGFRFNF